MNEWVSKLQQNSGELPLGGQEERGTLPTALGAGGMGTARVQPCC